MPGLREDNFIFHLGQLIEDYPEYADILEFVIDELKKRRDTQITAIFESIDNEQW